MDKTPPQCCLVSPQSEWDFTPAFRHLVRIDQGGEPLDCIARAVAHLHREYDRHLERTANK